MAKYYTNTEELELIADAIREKGGTNAQLTFPNEFVSAINNITGGGNMNLDIIAEEYDSTATYPTIGTYCIYNGDLYISTAAITTAELWNASHWTKTNVAGEIEARCCIQPALGVYF